MPMGVDDSQMPRKLTVSREPTGPITPGSKGSLGDQALMDGLALIVGAWIFLGVLVFSFRGFNV